MKYPAIVLIAFAFCLMCFAACAGEGTAKQEAVRGEAEEGKLYKVVQLPAHLLEHPTAVLCAEAGNKQEAMGAPATGGNEQSQPRRIEIPAGKNPTDLCSAIIERYYNIAPGVAYSAASYDNIPPPVGRLPNNKTTGPPP